MDGRAGPSKVTVSNHITSRGMRRSWENRDVGILSRGVHTSLCAVGLELPSRPSELGRTVDASGTETTQPGTACAAWWTATVPAHGRYTGNSQQLLVIRTIVSARYILIWQHYRVVREDEFGSEKIKPRLVDLRRHVHAHVHMENALNTLFVRNSTKDRA